MEEISTLKTGAAVVQEALEKGEQASSQIQASSIVPNILGFDVVAEGKIFRGARPYRHGMQELKAIGIRTVLSLEFFPAFTRFVKALAAEEGINFVNIAFPALNLPIKEPGDRTVDAAIAALKDPSNHPIFVHSFWGDDRTGLVVGLYRVEVERMSPEEAYDDMIKHKFHPALHGLDRYFRDRVGLSYKYIPSFRMGHENDIPPDETEDLLDEKLFQREAPSTKQA